MRDDLDITRTTVLDGGAQALLVRRLRLRVREPGGAEREVVVGQREIVIGSSADCDVVLADRVASRRHARLEADRNGYRLVDLGSKNGTWLNGVRVEAAWIRPGAAATIGESTVVFDLGEGEVEVRLSARDRFGDLLGTSPAMREVFGVLEKVAPTDLTVLVEGPSGTGKELVADAVHRNSTRRDAPFVVFDCSAVARELIESALFGHVRGAFTGAVASRAGAFEEASGGTLFIDEIGELAPDLQPKLLRALERREIRRVGSNDVVSVDVRVVAATNRSLRDEVAAGQFREDLYYRLAVVRVKLPPLVERPDDIPLLVEHFLRQARERQGNPALNVSWATMQQLRQHRWPGNVRELRNFIDRAAALAGPDAAVGADFLEPGAPPSLGAQPDPDALLAQVDPSGDLPFREAKERLVDAFEREYWKRLMRRTAGNVSQAARIAGVHRKSAEYILRKLETR